MASTDIPAEVKRKRTEIEIRENEKFRVGECKRESAREKVQERKCKRESAREKVQERKCKRESK